MNTPARIITREMRRQLERDNAKWPESLASVPFSEWPSPHYGATKFPSAVYRSRNFLVQCFQEADGIVRLSVARTIARADGNWDDGITWDELQDIKRQVGLGDHYAIEIYPKDRDVVNVANMRHLWVLRDQLNIGWFRS